MTASTKSLTKPDLIDAVTPAKRSTFHIPSLDGIRAASFFVVFLAHAGLEKWVPGYFGLTIFFFLSGYLITTLLRMEFDKTGNISFKEFYLRRVLRIFPPFYLILGAASLLTFLGLLDNSLQANAVLAQVLHISNYYVIKHGWWAGRAPGTWVYWSLAVEEHFYLIFPLFYLFLRRRLLSNRQQMLVLSGLCALVLAWRCLLIFGLHVPKDRVYVATDTRVDSILFGCILAVYGNPALDPYSIWERHLKTIWLPIGIGVLFVSLVIRNPSFEQTFRYTLQGLALLPLFIVAIRFPKWGPVRLLNASWMSYIGLLSYSLYLMHTTVLYGIGQWTNWHPVARGTVALGLLFLMASLIYYYIEKPCARLRKRFSRIRA